MDVNWEELEKELVTQTKNGNAELSSPRVQAIELILGSDFFVQAVEHAVHRKPGYKLARSLILDLKPWVAIKRCYDIFNNPPSTYCHNVQYEAYSLLKDIFDCRAILPPDPDAEYADPIEMGMYYSLELSQLPEILESALNHPSDYTRKQAAWLLSEDEEGLNRAKEYLAKGRAAIKASQHKS